LQLFRVRQALVRQSLTPIFPPELMFLTRRKNMTAKVSERRLTPNASGVQNIFNESSDFFF